MTENVRTTAKIVPKNKSTVFPKESVVKYPGMEFVVRFARLVATILTFAFVLFAVISLVAGIFTKTSFLWGMVNAGFYLLVGAVCVALIRGMGEVFELLLDLEKRL